MTQTSTTLSVDILLKAVSAAEADTLCARPQLDVVLRHSRVDIRLAREIQADDCVTAVVLEHEMKHVAIERDTLDWAAQQLQSRLQAHYADRVLRGSEAHIKARLVQDFDDTWTPVLEAILQSSGARHAAHDEQDSYGDAHACEGALYRVARTLQ